MPGGNRIRASESQIAEIEGLLELPSTVLSDRRRKRLLVLKELPKGNSNERIAKQCSVSDETVRKIRNEVWAEGLQKVVTDLKKPIAKKATAVAGTRRPRGAPRAKSLRSSISAKALRIEPIITLASLIVAGNIQIAVIGVQITTRQEQTTDREKKPPTVDGGGAYSEVLDAVRDPIAPRWTRGRIDEWIRRPFLFLPGTDPSTTTARLREASLPSLGSRFRKTWRFIVIGKGDQKELNRIISRFARSRNAETVLLASPSLVSHLEAVLHTLRVRLNYRGLLPTLDGLFEASMAWRERRRATFPFIWHSNERQAMAGAKDRVIDFYVRAAGGYLLDLTSHVRRSIPARSHFNVATVPTRPKVEVLSTDPAGEPILDYSPFPGIEMAFQTEPPISAAEARKVLAGCKAAARFEYAVRLGPDQRHKLRFPYELLSSKSQRPSAHLEIGVVSLVRQFFHPLQTAEELQRYAEALERRQKVVAVVKGNDGPILAFRSKAMLDGIYSAFALNRYGDRMAQINGHETWWRKQLSGPLAVNDFENFRPIGFLFDPPYHFSDAELNGTSVTEETQRRFNDCVIPEYAGRSDGLQKKSPKCRFPGYRREDAFQKMLLSFDADFLLRQLTEEDWSRLVEESDQWTAAVHEIVNQEFFPEGKPDTDKIIKTIRIDFRRTGARFRELLPGWAVQSRSAFESSERILRRALENAQRLALSGFPPLAVASVSRAQILASWKTYLGRSIRGRIEAEQPKKKIISSGEVEWRAEAMGADELVQWEEDVESIRLLLEAIWNVGASESDGRQFELLAFRMNRAVWSEAVRRLWESGKPRTFGMNVLKVLQRLKLVCRNPAKTPSDLAKIARQLNAARA